MYVPDGKPGPNDAPAVAFAKRLNRLLYEKGWKAQELVDRAQHHMPKGHTIKRQTMSAWRNGINMPNQMRVEALAKALGIKVTDLVPEGAATFIGDNAKPLQIVVGSNGLARVKIDMELPMSVAVKIMDLVQVKDT